MSTMDSTSKSALNSTKLSSTFFVCAPCVCVCVCAWEAAQLAVRNLKQFVDHIKQSSCEINSANISFSREALSLSLFLYLSLTRSLFIWTSLTKTDRDVKYARHVFWPQTKFQIAKSVRRLFCFISIFSFLLFILLRFCLEFLSEKL